MEESIKIVKITGEYVEVEQEIPCRGKTGGYFRRETVIVQILDKNNQEVYALWKMDRRESAPGIEIHAWCEGTDFDIGSHRHETHIAKRVRIHRAACPVRILFFSTDEYIDYDDSEFSSSHNRVYCVQYEV